MQCLVYNSPFGLSAKKLAQFLGIKAVRLSNLRQDTPIVSWGAPRAIATSLNAGIKVDKLRQLQTWKSADLTTIDFSSTPQTGWLPRSGASFGGRDFEEELQNPAYWTKPVMNIRSEYRVHLCLLPGKKRGNPSSYRVIRLGYKVNSDPSLNKKVAGVQIKSRQFGWHLAYFLRANLRENLSDNLNLAARWAIATIGWDFGAIDVLKTADGKYVLLEANSAPGLKDDATCQAYADAIKEILDA